MADTGFNLRSLYNNWESTTPEGSEIFERALKALEPIMRECVAKGIRVRDVSHELISAVTILEAETILRRNLDSMPRKQNASST